jgi:signal transduction histidine kinase
VLTAPVLHDPGRLASDDAIQLLSVAGRLSACRDLASVMAVVRRSARELMRADGVTFVLREGEQVFYADEDAIGPLWKGRRFPASACVSGWAIAHRESVAIEDIYKDTRVPVEAYRPTFVNSLLMVPIRVEDPIGAIGAYWASHHLADSRQIALLESLAGFAAVAVANAELNQNAQDAIRARDEWLGIASHELKTPITPVRMNIQSALRAAASGRPTAVFVERLERALSSVDRLAHLVDRLLDYSRLSNTGFRPSRETVDLAAVARDVAEQLRPQAERVGCRFEVDASGPVCGSWDRLLVEEVCTNLLSNAVKYGCSKPVVVEVSAAGGRARLVVRDHGGGIAAEHHERVFQPFARLDENAPGVGLGLWIVRQIVQAHDGTISIASAPGQGTSMIVELPAGAPPAALRATATSGIAPGRVAPPG